MWSQLPHAIAEFLPLALGVALSPLPLIAAVVIALGPGGGRRGSAFLAGRFAGVLVLVGVFSALSEVLTGLGGSSAVLAVVKALLGLALLVLGVRTWLRRPRGEAADEPPAWMASLDGLGTPRCLGTGFVLSVANPKELAFGAGAGVVIGSTLTEAWPSVVAVAVFGVIGCATTALPVGALLVGGERLRPALDNVRTWLIRSNSTITALVMLFFGIVLIANSFS